MTRQPPPGDAVGPPTLATAARLDRVAALRACDTRVGGLTSHEAAARLASEGPNAVRTHGAEGWRILAAQLRSPLLLLLGITAAVSAVVGYLSEALIIAVILAASVGLGFASEYRAARAAADLHRRMRHVVEVRRDGELAQVDVVSLVRGDIVFLHRGTVVPADLRLLQAEGLSCDESLLTGESMPAAKDARASSAACCALMGTVVSAGAGVGVVVATGARTAFGTIAVGLGEREPETQFQQGLRRFSGLLLGLATVLAALVFLVNLVMGRGLIEALLFSLAIAVGISPQLLPAIVATSMAVGARQLAGQRVLVKRLVCIEDLGDIDVLFTDKTGTLTQGSVAFMRALDAHGVQGDAALLPAMLLALPPGTGGDATLEEALRESPATARHLIAARDWAIDERAPFDGGSRISAATATGPDGRAWRLVQGAPESVLPRCTGVTPTLEQRLADEFAAGNRVIAVAHAALDASDAADAADAPMMLAGLLVFSDPAKVDAMPALGALEQLGIAVKVVTGDNPAVAEHVCDELGIPPGRTLTGAQVEELDDEGLTARIPATRVFARMDPGQKARIVRLARASGSSIAYLGDGVNDALALHAADVGISVDTGADVAKDAADVILLEKELGILASGVVQGRRVFANTMKYILMGTSSNVGNMVSAAAASAVIPFLPMLPSQILLNNLLYDSGQVTIPVDRVDADELRRPSHWDLRMVRRFMLTFGPLSSAFDIATFALLLAVLHVSEPAFRTGWFVESLATQSLVIFVIRTRARPFLRSRPSPALVVSVLAELAVGIGLTRSAASELLGFTPLPLPLMALLGVIVIAYLVVVDACKTAAFRRVLRAPTPARPAPHRRVHRRAARFGVGQPRLPTAGR